jgi:pimeloyl-ACP methyl ester carboxylesterase
MRFGTTIAGVGEPTFVLLHGLASTRRIWDLVVPHLRADHRVIAFDLRGHGETEKPEFGYSLDDLADDLDEATRRYGVMHPVLVGHSAGANLALHHAVTRRSARGIVLVDGGLVEMHAHLSWDRAETVLAPPGDDAYQIERFIRDGWAEVPNSPQLVEIRRSLFEWDKNGEVRKRLSRERHLSILRSLWEQDVHAELAALACPALVVVCHPPRGADARWTSQKELAAARVARLPRVRVTHFADTIHDIPVQRPRELAETILEFSRGLSVEAHPRPARRAAARS